jgi:hypothetical protein
MSALKPQATSTKATGSLPVWPQLNLPDISSAGLSPASTAALTSWQQSLQSWYAQVQGAVSQQLAAVNRNAAAANTAATAAQSTADSAQGAANNAQTSANTANANALAAVVTSDLEDGILSADDAGRKKMADQYLVAAKCANGTFAPDDISRKPFAPGFATAAMLQPDAYFYGSASMASTGTVVEFDPPLASYPSPFTGYWDGLLIGFRAPATVAAAGTVDAGYGPVEIYRVDGTSIQAGDIQVNEIVYLVFNYSFNNGQGGWQLLQVIPPPPPARTVTAIALPAAGATSQAAHGLGAMPSAVRVVAVLTANAGGLTTGMEVSVESLSGASVNTGSLSTITCPRPLTVSVDAVNVTVRREGAHLYLNNNGTLADIVAGCSLKVYAGS